MDETIAILIERGERALSHHFAEPSARWDPLLSTVIRYLDEFKGGDRDRTPILHRLEGNAAVDGYRWVMEWVDDPANAMSWARRPGQDAPVWRPREVRPGHEADHVGRLTQPLILAEMLDFLEDTAERRPDLAAEARALRDESEPRISFDFALHILADDAWSDTWALWLLSRRERALARLEHLAIAIATRFAQRARYEGEAVRGTRFPYFQTPLVSASAHVASALWTLDLYPELIPSLLSFVRERQRPDGGWGDDGQPSDLLTTLAAVDALAHLDPTFTLEPAQADGLDPSGRAAARAAVRYMAERQEPTGWWRAVDPETPWLTAEICRWLRAIEQPFPLRFRWPRLARWQRDRKTQVPNFAFFEDLSDAAAHLGGLGDLRVEVAFLDLIGFGEWNNRFGAAAGDRLLRVFATTAAAIPNSLVVRDGGDEFLVVGKPGLSGDLQGALEAFMVTWRERCAAEFADRDHVFARAVLGEGAMRDALAIRDRLGQAVGTIKGLAPEVPSGVMAVLDGTEVRVLHGSPR